MTSGELVEGRAESVLDFRFVLVSRTSHVLPTQKPQRVHLEVTSVTTGCSFGRMDLALTHSRK